MLHDYRIFSGYYLSKNSFMLFIAPWWNVYIFCMIFINKNITYSTFVFDGTSRGNDIHEKFGFAIYI